MKKLWMLLNFVGCVSTTFGANSAVSPSSHYDDCDRKIPVESQAEIAAGHHPLTMPVDTNVGISSAASVRHWLSALVTPKGSPGATSPTSGQPTLLAPIAGPLMPEKEPRAPNNTPEHQPDCATTVIPLIETTAVDQKTPQSNFPELRIYYSTIYKGTESSKSITLDQLQTNYAALNIGEHFMATFVPNIKLDIEVSNSDRSFLDTFAWLANVRAWVKWWLNPWAWWDSSFYVLEETDRIEWDESAAGVKINTSLKDIGYLESQLHQFLLDGWKAKYAPYIVPSTRERFEEALLIRFEKVEKVALEAVGFKDVSWGTRLNLTTQRLEYYVKGTK